MTQPRTVGELRTRGYASRSVKQEMRDNLVTRLRRDRRYGEKLATPDITIADLIGEVDPIKVAEGRYLADELTIHYGLLPRTHRGIFALNELPDLAERIQVGLLNIMEERDVQIRGYKVRLPIDVYVVASANPEDYTNRAIRLGETDAAPRVSDLGALVASTAGKIELETLGDTSEDKILGKLVQRAVLNVFNRALTPAELDPVVTAFQGGLSVQVSDAMPSAEYVRQAEKTPALRAAAQKLGGDGASGLASAVEFVLEGLHLSKKLNKDSQPGQTRYRS